MTLQNLTLTQLEDPNNRKIVNEGQPYFEVVEENDTIWFSVFNYAVVSFDNSPEFIKFTIIRHCIAALPVFEAPNPQAKVLTFTGGKRAGLSGIHKYVNELYKYYPQTIRQALLSAPVLTLEELEEFAKKNNLIPTI